MKSERIDGIDYEVGTPGWEQARRRHDEAQTVRIAELEAAKKKAEGERDAAIGERDAHKQRADAAEAKIKASTDAAELADVGKRATTILGAEYKADGKSALDVMRDALMKHDAALDLKGKSDEYVRARFDAATSKAVAAQPTPLDRARRDALPVPTTPGPALPPPV